MNAQTRTIYTLARADMSRIVEMNDASTVALGIPKYSSRRVNIFASLLRLKDASRSGFRHISATGRLLARRIQCTEETMAGADLFANYYIQIEWVLTWFPIRQGAAIDRPMMRNGTIHHRSSEFGPGLGAGSGDTHWLGEVEGLPPTQTAIAWATVYADLDNNLSATLDAKLGAKTARLLLPTPPGQRMPFMLNISEGHGGNTEGTSLSVFGTISTGSRFPVAIFTPATMGP
ncbi:MAG: hypothetical protein ACRC67_16815 [Inquilinus sp.]|uniref:hypothetical protein n=1 Tax=Inquilinus sp. TaxID=1932117 RepID=UPI003F3F5CC4